MLPSNTLQQIWEITPPSSGFQLYYILKKRTNSSLFQYVVHLESTRWGVIFKICCYVFDSHLYYLWLIHEYSFSENLHPLCSLGNWQFSSINPHVAITFWFCQCHTNFLPNLCFVVLVEYKGSNFQHFQTCFYSRILQRGCSDTRGF